MTVVLGNFVEALTNLTARRFATILGVGALVAMIVVRLLIARKRRVIDAFDSRHPTGAFKNLYTIFQPQIRGIFVGSHIFLRIDRIFRSNRVAILSHMPFQSLKSYSGKRLLHHFLNTVSYAVADARWAYVTVFTPWCT